MSESGAAKPGGGPEPDAARPEPVRHVLAVGREMAALVTPDAAAWTAAGCAVTCAQTGAEALRELLNQRYAAVLLGASLTDMPVGVFLEEAAKLAPATALVVAAAGWGPSPRFCAVGPLPTGDALRQAVARVAPAGAAAPDGPQSAILHSLNRIEDIIVATAHTQNALGEVCLELADLSGSAVAAIYLLRSTGPCFVIGSRGPVPPALAERLTQETEKSFRRLSSLPLVSAAPVLHVRDESAPAPHAGPHTVSVPLLADCQVKGVLAVCTGDGAADKPLLPATLFHLGNHAVLTYLEVWRARNMAARDPLTGLYNRAMFTEAFKQTFSLAQRKSGPVAVLIFDLDHLKLINDQYGHLTGDEVLRQAANAALATVRTADIVARFGGDEFAVVLPDTDLVSVRRVADRLLNAFRSRPFAGAAGPLRVTVSAGIASTCPTRESTAQALLAQADEGLLAAKRAGRNCVCEAGGEPPAAAAQEIAEISATETRGRVLIVDDEQSVRDVLGRLMRSLNFATVTSGALDEAYREIETRAEEFDIVLTDLRLGNGTGIDLLQALKEKAPWTVKMVVSGYASKETAIACLRHGAFDFIEKPFAYAQIVAAMDRALEYRRLLVDNRRYQMQLEELVRSRSESLTQALDGLRRSYSQTIQALAMLIEAREAGTGVHCRATREAVRLLAREVGVAPHDVEAMEMGAMLHDIGKIAVPDAVLLKAGPLTDEERRVVRSHARIGHDLLREVPFLYDASQIVLQHHEFYDGTGYPDGLRGDAICLGARVFAVVDAYHAMRSTRCYREEIPEQAARDEIVRGAGRQFDPAVVAAFLRCQPEIEDAFRTLPDTPPDFLTTV